MANAAISPEGIDSITVKIESPLSRYSTDTESYGDTAADAVYIDNTKIIKTSSAKNLFFISFLKTFLFNYNNSFMNDTFFTVQVSLIAGYTPKSST